MMDGGKNLTQKLKFMGLPLKALKYYQWHILDQNASIVASHVETMNVIQKQQW